MSDKKINDIKCKQCGYAHPIGTDCLPRASNPADCEHDWKEEYYGTRCAKCQTFYAFGCEPWSADDDALAELQAIRTCGDDLRDAGEIPLYESPNNETHP